MVGVTVGLTVVVGVIVGVIDGVGVGVGGVTENLDDCATKFKNISPISKAKS
jgi:hypothetical protein